MPSRNPASPRSEPAHAERSALGQRGEDLAAAHLDRRGLEVVARNWRLSAGELRGELDLVALDHRTGTVVVVEVKTRRSSSRFGGPVAAVTPRKQAKVRALAGMLLVGGDLPYARVRFDVIAVVAPPDERPTIEHLKGVF